MMRRHRDAVDEATVRRVGLTLMRVDRERERVELGCRGRGDELQDTARDDLRRERRRRDARVRGVLELCGSCVHGKRLVWGASRDVLPEGPARTIGATRQTVNARVPRRMCVAMLPCSLAARLVHDPTIDYAARYMYDKDYDGTGNWCGGCRPQAASRCTVPRAVRACTSGSSSTHSG